MADNIAEYLVPQESGNKCRVRYAKVMDKKGRGMLFFGDELSFSALPYTPHELENAAHHFELPPVHYTVVRVAKKQMGVGGDDSWGSHTHPEYLLDVSEKWNSHSVSAEFSILRLSGILLHILRAETATVAALMV